MNKYIVHCISETYYEICAESEDEARWQAEEWFMDRYPLTTIESVHENISCANCAHSSQEDYTSVGCCNVCGDYDMQEPRGNTPRNPRNLRRPGEDHLGPIFNPKHYMAFFWLKVDRPNSKI